MCLYPRLIKNKKYTENKKNGGLIPAVTDKRTLYVPIKCGNCMECQKQKQHEWKIRLMEDITTYKNGKFITLTFSNESYTELANNIQLTGYPLDNQIATIATRRFLERWRKTYKKSIRHWLITELGHNGTENIHLHGIIWTDATVDEIKKTWAYGYIYPRYNTWKGNYVSEQTIQYISKYITKVDLKHKTYKPIILCSPGIGQCYTNKYNATTNKYKPQNTKETYTDRAGFKTALPIYWRNKIYTEEEKEKLWIEKLNKQIRYVNGIKIDVSKNEKEYWDALKWARKKNISLGYGTHEKDYNQIEYENKIRELKQLQRIQDSNKNKKIITNKERIQIEYETIINNYKINTEDGWKPYKEWDEL